MFFPPKRQTIIAVFVAIATVAVSTQAMAWQNSEFERRAAAMQAARARGGQSPAASSARTAPVAATQAAPQSIPIAAHSIAVQPRGVSSRKRVAGSGRRNVRVAQAIQGGGSATKSVPFSGGQIINEGQVYQGQVYENVIYDDSYVQGPHVEGSFIDEPYIEDSYAEDSYTETSYFEDDSCSTCYSDTCDGRCYGRPFWFGSVRRALQSGEYFGGATSFQSPLFTAPGQTPPVDDDQVASDSSFGVFGGFNLGVPLYQLSGGLLSGQFGIRSVTSNFNGNEFSSEDRRQIFVTAGVYRRVDYGLQLGVVADIFHEEWFTETDLVQIRGDISWVYPAGHTFGFRFATGVQDDETEGTFNGEDFIDFFQETEDNYRFYYRHLASSGGWGEVFVGWGDATQTIVGVDVDLPVTDRISFQSGFTAYFNDDVVSPTSNFQGGNLNEAWNLFVGLSFKPHGRGWYKSYDRPLFSVADNGTLLVRRQSPEIQ